MKSQMATIGTKGKMMNMKVHRNRIICSLLAMLLVFALTGCGTGTAKATASLTQKATYKITLSGQATEPGVLNYASYEMNVYKDQASNPCGDCPDQPVSFFVGTSTAEIINDLDKAIKRADDIWDIQSKTDNSLTLVEKEIGTTEKPEKPSAPAGLTIQGTFTPAR